ncbi:ADP-ribosyltransferase family protein [Aquimarina sediminis]|uniref:hypothetical protein n=1 Tax=Aquimarina sediminis TaxID=2070536 RepID=UPI000CA02C52|nr:hypothetical protein [Aquimarina sediminis]
MKRIIKIYLAIFLFLCNTVLSLAQDCEWERFKKDTDETSINGKALAKAIDENPDLLDAWKVLSDEGVDDAIRINISELELVSKNIDKIKAFDGGYNAWKINNTGGKLITDAERALLWGKSGSSFRKAKKSLEKSGLLDEFKTSYPELDELEIISIYRYTASSKNLNNPLNAGQALTGKLELHQKMMNATLDKLKNTKLYDKLVFRGANLDESLVINKYINNVGKEITEDAFTSSSKLEKVADDFIEKFRDPNKIQAKYYIQSKTGIDINDMSHYTKVVGENQAEVLFKSGTKFIVESAEKNTEGIFEIVLREF